MIIIKVRILDCDDLRRFSLEENATFEHFSGLLSSIYPRIEGLLDIYQVKYADDEGDLQTIEETKTLAEAIRQAAQLTPPVLRITLVPMKNVAKPVTQISVIRQPHENPVVVVRSIEPVEAKDRGTPQIKKPLVAGPLDQETLQNQTPELNSSQQNIPYRFQNVISNLSDEMARKSLTGSLVITEATQKMGTERAKEFGDFADGLSSLYSDIISKNGPNRFVVNDDREALDTLCVETVNKCDALNQSLSVQTQEQLARLHVTLQENDVDTKRLAELCESNIKTTFELASSVLSETRQHVGNILERSMGSSTPVAGLN